MSTRPHCDHAPTLQVKVARTAVRNAGTLTEMPKRFAAHPGQIAPWQDQLLSGASGDFGCGPRRVDRPCEGASGRRICD